MTATRRVIPDPTEYVPGQLVFDVGPERAGRRSPADAVQVTTTPSWTAYRGREDCTHCYEDQAIATAAGEPPRRRRRALWTRQVGTGQPTRLCGEHAETLMTTDQHRKNRRKISA